MEPSIHTLNNLFMQLGLESSDAGIAEFIETHQLAKGVDLEHAPFWNEAQIHFITESREEDADWAELVDELDTLLHKADMQVGSSVNL